MRICFRSVPPSLGRSSWPLVAALALALGAGGVGCSTAREAAPAPNTLPRASGFLSDYSKLQPSEQFADILFYRAPSLPTFQQLRVRPIKVWRSAETQLDNIPEGDLQYLADDLYDAVYEKLSKSFQVVNESGPGVLDIHLALTLVTDPESKIDAYATEVPVPDLPARTSKLNPETRAFLRDCALEAEFTEVVSDTPGGRRGKSAREVRAAFFDARRGSETPKGSVETWSDVDAVFERFANLLDERFSALRDGSFTPKLTEKK